MLAFKKDKVDTNNYKNNNRIITINNKIMICYNNKLHKAIIYNKD